MEAWGNTTHRTSWRTAVVGELTANFLAGSVRLAIAPGAPVTFCSPLQTILFNKKLFKRELFKRENKGL